MRSFDCILIAMALAAAPAVGQTPEPRSVVTELAGERCRALGSDTEAAGSRSCRGHGGAQVIIRKRDGLAILGLSWSDAAEVTEVVRGHRLGSDMEWRGLVARKGFEPYAAIIRVIAPDPASPRGGGAVLAVLRVEPEEAKACPIAFIDAGANRDADGLARRTADELGPAFLCESDRPIVVGRPTRWTASLIQGR